MLKSESTVFVKVRNISSVRLSDKTLLLLKGMETCLGQLDNLDLG